MFRCHKNYAVLKNLVFPTVLKVFAYGDFANLLVTRKQPCSNGADFPHHAVICALVYDLERVHQLVHNIPRFLLVFVRHRAQKIAVASNARRDRFFSAPLPNQKEVRYNMTKKTKAVIF